MQSVTTHRMQVARCARFGNFISSTRSSSAHRETSLHRRPLSLIGAASPDKEQTPEMSTPTEPLSADSVLERLSRYDFLSAGLPSLAVVSVFVANGQDPWKALSKAFCATVVSVVVNEFLFEDEKN